MFVLCVCVFDVQVCLPVQEYTKARNWHCVFSSIIYSLPLWVTVFHWTWRLWLPLLASEALISALLSPSFQAHALCTGPRNPSPGSSCGTSSTLSTWAMSPSLLHPFTTLGFRWILRAFLVCFPFFSLTFAGKMPQTISCFSSSVLVPDFRKPWTDRGNDKYNIKMAVWKPVR